MPANRAILEVRTAKDSQETPEATAQFLASIGSVLKGGFFQELFSTQSTLTLEIASLNQLVYFIVTCAAADEPLVRSQIAAQYPTAIITAMEDYLPPWSQYGQQSVGQVSLAAPYFLPLKTYLASTTTDPISGILGIMGKLPYGTAAVMQIVITKAHKNWTSGARAVIKQGVGSDPTVFKAHPQQALIEEKIRTKAYAATIRLLAVAKEQADADSILSQLSSSMGTYALSENNSLSFKKVKNKPAFIQAMIDRSAKFLPRHQYFNILELASLFHFPTELNTGLRNLTWGKTMKGEPPDNLPVDENLTPDQRRDVTFFAKTEFKNRMTTYGLRLPDRRRHFYTLGKSGTGKSTLIAKMAIDDIYKGQGLAVIDPHGDLVEGILLDFIPDHRINDVVYLDPSITDHPFHINPLEVLKPEYKDLTVSNIMSIFTKLWANVWSARMEYILRNTLATLVEVPGSTFLDLPRLLTDDAFRAAIMEKIDPEEFRVIHDFWNSEYNAYNDKFRNEAIAPILNKVGQFIASPKIRSIVGHPTSTVNIEALMNTGKIVLINLSQGKVGEENAALLGAMFITQFQLAAMNRINIAEEDRKDFFLYVDEFQNFATTSFIKILSEARKYRLGLVLANQYMAQLEEPIQKAVFGNVGTIVTFVVGADDATRLIGEFGALYTQDDLVNLGKHQIINKVTIENRISNPFPGYTIPPDEAYKTGNRQKVIEMSRSQFSRHKDAAKVMSLRELIPPVPKPLPVTKESREATKAQLIGQVKVGDTFTGKVTSLKDYGAFVEIIPGLEGLVHVSNMGKKYVKHPSDVVKEGDQVQVKVTEIVENKINLTMKLEEKKSSSPSLPRPPQAHKSSPVPHSNTKLPSLAEFEQQRHQGFRPTVIGCLIKDKKVLLGFRKAYNLWQIPQGGIEAKEEIKDSYQRKISAETGLDISKYDSFEYLGEDRVEFPPQKQGGQDLTTDSGTSVTMKGKTYYILAIPAPDLQIPPASGEYDELRWCTASEAKALVKNATQGGKLRVTLLALDLLLSRGLITPSQALPPLTTTSTPAAEKKTTSIFDYEAEDEE